MLIFVCVASCWDRTKEREVPPNQAITEVLLNFKLVGTQRAKVGDMPTYVLQMYTLLVTLMLKAELVA